MTIHGRLKYDRMTLFPSTPKDKKALKELGINGYVYPLDEALGISHLPFNVTVASMLEIASISTKSGSFEDAEKDLRKYTNISINDDTMRRITNHVGSIVFQNDKMVAEKFWEQFKTGNLIFSNKKIDHTLYIEVDGAMVPTRQENQKGCIDTWNPE